MHAPSTSKLASQPHRVPVRLLLLEDADRLQRHLDEGRRLGEGLDLNDVVLFVIDWSGATVGVVQQCSLLIQHSCCATQRNCVLRQANQGVVSSFTLFSALRDSSAASSAGIASSRSAWASSAIAWNIWVGGDTNLRRVHVK
jgi:hypothetical protein